MLNLLDITSKFTQSPCLNNILYIICGYVYSSHTKFHSPSCSISLVIEAE